MDRALLHQHIAGVQQNTEFVHQHFDFAFKDNDIIQGVGAMHGAAATRKQVHDHQSRAVRRRTGVEPKRAHIVAALSR